MQKLFLIKWFSYKAVSSWKKDFLKETQFHEAVFRFWTIADITKEKLCWNHAFISHFFVSLFVIWTIKKKKVFTQNMWRAFIRETFLSIKLFLSKPRSLISQNKLIMKILQDNRRAFISIIYWLISEK